MRAVGVHADVIVTTSRVWQTTCTAVRGGEEAFVIDSPVFPDELEVLPAVMEQAGLAVRGLLVTHADWDHLLARLAFPTASIGCAETTAARLAAEPGAVQRKLREFDSEHYVERPAPLSLPAAQALPVPGHCEVGGEELQLHPADGHTADGMAILVPWARVLVCGDYLSPVELPMLAEGGSLKGYLATLARLDDLIGEADTVVPGHGDPLAADRARGILAEDAAYLQALRESGADARLPHGRDSAAQQRIHAANVEQVGG